MRNRTPELNDETLLREALHAPAPGQAFADSLREQTVQQFHEHQRGAAEEPNTLDTLLAMRRELRAGDVDNLEHRRSVAQARRALRELSGDPPAVFSFRRKLALAAAAAAILIACVWSVPGYTWGRTLAALQDEQWVLVTEFDGDDQRTAWLSTRVSVPLLWKPQADLESDSQPTRLRAGGGAVADSLLQKKRPVSELESQLYLLLADGVEGASGDTVQPVAVVSSRVQAVDRGVEITLTLKSRDSSLRARLLVDAETHLPLACDVLPELTPNAPPEWVHRIAFSYPKRGPNPTIAAHADQPPQTVAVLASW